MKAKEFLTTRGVSQKAGVSYQTAKYWVDNNILPSVPTEKGWRLVPKAALERFLSGELQKTESPAGGAGEA